MTERLTPDLVILDLRMPLMNGFQAAREISRINPHPAMLLVTVQQLSQSHLEAARSGGFSGAVNKNCGPQDFESCGRRCLTIRAPFTWNDPFALHEVGSCARF